MSSFSTKDLPCPRCGEACSTRIADSVNAARLATARDDILAGRFHRLHCPACGIDAPIDAPFLYSDAPRGQFVQVKSLSAQREWAEHEATWRATLERAATGPPFVAELVLGPCVRLVFGVDALAEKLRIWNAGLSDVAVEALKASIAALLPDRPRGLCFLSATKDALTFDCIDDRGRSAFEVARTSYELMTEGTARGPWVDWRR